MHLLLEKKCELHIYTIQVRIVVAKGWISSEKALFAFMAKFKVCERNRCLNFAGRISLGNQCVCVTEALAIYLVLRDLFCVVT